ncbi:Rha family transcriptional regulator [Hymenobacter convexus]|uniref:Rha family transcriptional regulator n=1 Tax=Hymenobacter sp. CA1UV-4 TaxID=3063782 RepID=UPI00271323A9|nr:Rha family transcriptional regulator [Hymenobacter sp. CA1UV-4]MDO7852957.1 Rha family transcriptional regulator [Hymenobacter sp. CA1UV-4]
MTQVVPKPKKKAALKPTADTLVRKSPTTGNPITDSLKVAAGFGKTHGNVLQAIDRMECDATFSRMNFHSSTYTDGRGKQQRFVVMTEAGFTFLVTGFTGKRAAIFKQGYIAQFEKMRSELALRNQPINLAEHTERAIQLSNSKAANKLNFETGGKGGAIGYSQRSCEIHTGKRPNVIVAQARAAGLPTKFLKSAKEVLRQTQPAVACCMSLADSLLLRGIPIDEAAVVTKKATPLFAGLIGLGIGIQQLDPSAKRIR